MGDLRKLAEPFPGEDIEWFIGATTKDKTRGLAIPFITNRAVQERLDEVCGPDGWRNEYKTLGEREIYDNNSQYIGKKSSQLCGISIWSEERQEWITKWDGAEESDIEAIKGSLSSAMKRAAVQWGIGRYLYYLESPWVEIESQGRSHKIKDNQVISLPGWALPGGTGKPGINDLKKPAVDVIGYGYTAPPIPQQPQQPQMQQNAPQNAPQQPYGQQQAYGAPQQPVQPNGAPADNRQAGKLTVKQVDRALKKGQAANQTKEDIILWVQKKYGVNAIEDLNRTQYDELCAALDRSRVQ